MVTIHVPTPDTPRKILKSLEAGGKPVGRLAGGWVDDFAALRKAIMLCEFCSPRFNAKQNKYAVWRRDIYAIAKCDGCNQTSRHIKTYIHESTVPDVGEEPRRRRGRWSKGFR